MNVSGSKWLLGLLLCHSLVSIAICKSIYEPIPSRNAYATIHYEGTERDAEYLLGIRTLVKSIKLTDKEHDVIVLATDSVTQKSRDILTKDGAKIVPIPPIPNPYKDDPERRKYYTPRFEMTLIKLHLWNQTQYDRLIYMDADCVVLHNTAELFKCGHFCAAYMNVLAFHTAVLVVKPDAKVFQDMLDQLPKLESYDGADQGFLVSYFKDMQNAPYFDPKNPSPEDKMNRLAIGYSMNHIYYYEKSTWDNGWRQGQFKDLDIPAYILTFPIAVFLKPFYWWGYIWLKIHWVWDSYRVQLPESWSSSVVARIILLTSFIFAMELFVMKRLLKRNPFSMHDLQLSNSTDPVRIHGGFYSKVVGAVWFFFANYIVFLCIPVTMPPSLALPLFFFSQNVLFFYIAAKGVQVLEPTRPVTAITILQAIAVGCVTDLVLYWIASADYSNPVFKIWLVLITLIFYATVPVLVFVKYLLRNRSLTSHKI